LPKAGKDVQDLAKNRIKDTDYLYASSRIKALETNLLTKDRLQRMCEARTMEEALKVLSESDWPDIPAPTLAAVEEILALRRKEAFTLVRSLAPDKHLPDVFLIKYDYHNIKTILRSEVTGEGPEPLLIDAGIISPKQMLFMLRESSFSGLSKNMVEAIEEGRDVLSRTQDPQLLDFVLDKAMFTDMLELAKKFGSDFLLGYVKLMIDSVNLRTVVRLRRMNKGYDVLRFALVPGGNVDISRFLGEITPELIENTFATSPLAEAAQAGVKALKGEGKLAEMDLACDNALIKYLKGAKYVAFGAEPLIGYLAALEAEITAVRTIMAGRLAELSPEKIIERLRETYV